MTRIRSVYLRRVGQPCRIYIALEWEAPFKNGLSLGNILPLRYSRSCNRGSNEELVRAAVSLS